MYWQAECTQVDRSTWPQPACQIFYIAASNNHCVLQTREHNGSVGGIPPSTLSVLIRKINRFSFLQLHAQSMAVLSVYTVWNLVELVWKVFSSLLSKLEIHSLAAGSL